MLRARVLLPALAIGLNTVATHAYPLDAQFDCEATPHAFIEDLIDQHAIDPKPSRVEANSVNAFRPVHGSDLTAFGFHVYAVLGYQQDDGMFKPGNGTPLTTPLYGAVLSGPSETVQIRVREAGSTAMVKSVVPQLLTAVICGPP